MCLFFYATPLTLGAKAKAKAPQGKAKAPQGKARAPRAKAKAPQAKAKANEEVAAKVVAAAAKKGQQRKDLATAFWGKTIAVTLRGSTWIHIDHDVMMEEIVKELPNPQQAEKIIKSSLNQVCSHFYEFITHYYCVSRHHGFIVFMTPLPLMTLLPLCRSLRIMDSGQSQATTLST